MKWYCIFIPFILQACSSSRTLVHLQKPPANPYHKIGLLYTENTEEIHQWNAAYFETAIKKQFNNLNDARVRQQLEATFRRNFSLGHTSVLPLSQKFQYNDSISYSRFMQVMQEEEAVDALLIVVEKNYWETPSVYQTGNERFHESPEPNADFMVYLADIKTGQIIWVSESIIKGIFAGFDTLNNKLARKVHRKLQEQGFIN